MKFWNSLIAQEVAAVVSALVLAIGAVIEYWSKIKFLTLLALKWILRRSTQFDRCTFRRLFIHSIGPILVVLGIAGEFVFEGRTFVLGYKQEQEAQSAVASLKEKASANERDKEQLRKDAAQLQKDAESEHLARAKIEARVAWRHLSESQKAEIGAALRRFSNQGVSFWYGAGDIESSMFTDDIAEAVSQAKTLRIYAPAGMVRTQEGGPANLGKPIVRMETGVFVQHTKESHSFALAEAIVKELDARGFNAVMQDHAEIPTEVPTQVWVDVEPRPEGPQGEFKLQAEGEAKANKPANNSE